jgi:hypothetical protein
MGEVPEDLVEELLELALAREDKEGYAAGLADHREYMVFIKDPRREFIQKSRRALTAYDLLFEWHMLTAVHAAQRCCCVLVHHQHSGCQQRMYACTT